MSISRSSSPVDTLSGRLSPSSAESIRLVSASPCTVVNEEEFGILSEVRGDIPVPYLEELKLMKDYYQCLPSKYNVIQDKEVSPLAIIQLTPLGAKIVSSYYNRKYNIDITIVDHTDALEMGDNLNARFREFNKTLDKSILDDGKPRGFLLMHGFHHVVPFILAKENGIYYMTVFDSTSGAREKGYSTVANMFPDFIMLLNKGSRQSDIGSCVSDGIAILKDALRINQLATFLMKEKLVTEEKVVTEKEVEVKAYRPRFFINSGSKSVKLFRMPEALLRTAQSSRFFYNSEPDQSKRIGKHQKTLLEKRKTDMREVVFYEDGIWKKKEMSLHLYKKGREYALLVDLIVAGIVDKDNPYIKSNKIEALTENSQAVMPYFSS